MIMESERALAFTSPIGRGRIALAIRVRGYSLSIDRNPSPARKMLATSPDGRGDTANAAGAFQNSRAGIQLTASQKNPLPERRIFPAYGEGKCAVQHSVSVSQ